MPNCRGITLVELLAVAAILAVLGGVALPAFSAMLESARAEEARGALLSSLSTAVTKAIVAGQHTVLCPSPNGQRCSQSMDWTPGWIVFVDRDADRDRDEGESVVYRRPALPGHVRLVSSTGRARIVFQASGSNAGSNVTFTLCDGRGPAQAKSLIVNNQGRLRQAPATAQAAASCEG